MSEAGRTIAFYSAVVVALVFVAVRRSRPTTGELRSAIASLRPPNYDEMGMGPGGTATLIPRRPSPYVPRPAVIGGPAGATPTLGPMVSH